MLKRAVIARLRPFMANRVYTVRRGLARGLSRRGGLGFLPQVGTPSSEELFLETLNFAGKTVYDVGGFEGVLSLFFARRVGPTGRLITFEPNPENYATIVGNISLNGFSHVDIRPIALGAEPGSATLVFPTDEPAKGSLVGDIQAQILREKHVDTVEVPIETIDRLVAAGLPVPDFVKIDVEGLELDVLRGMANVIASHRPALYIEIHGADMAKKLENATAVIEYLWRAGYAMRHVESGLSMDTAARIPAASRGHLYCLYSGG